jgi:hypothetical protein
MISNVGNCYNHSKGVFNPSVSGVYVFDVHLLQRIPGHSVNAELVVEGVNKGGIYAGGSTTCVNGGLLTIASDSVWVRISAAQGSNSLGWETSFSGYLLYAD